MIGYLSKKGQKRAAWFLFFLFYFQFVGYAFAGTLNNSNNYPAYNSGVDYNSRNVLLNLNNLGNSPAIFDAASTLNSRVSKEVNKSSDIINFSNQSPMIGGPGQPEMGTFKSIGADNMVNLFTGDFSYNIPLLDVGGYPVNIFYNAGNTMDQDPSWTGLGWNINPGTISRNMRGVPDDFDGSGANGDTITKVQNIKKDLTIGVKAGANIETVGLPIGVGLEAGIFWNNRKGVSMEAGANFSIQTSITKKSGTELTTKDTVGSLSASAGATLNSQNGLSLNAGFDVSLSNSAKNVSRGLSTSLDYNSRQGLNDLKIEQSNSFYGKVAKSYPAVFPGLFGGTISFARSSFTPGIRMPVTRYNGNLKIKLGGEISVVHINGYVAGSLSNTYIAEDDQKQTKPSYGYMYYEKANLDKNALLDFNRLNDGTYTLKTPVISIPNYTYDIFSISGEGTGGTFRGYRGNMGFVRDNYTKSREGALSLSIDVGAGFLFHGGTEIGGVYSKTEVGDWTRNNVLRNSIKFNETDSIYQSFYFKNPAEKAIIDEAYYSAIGTDQLVRPKLTNLGLALPTAGSSYEKFDSAKKYVGDAPLNSTNTVKRIRDKRTQIITYLTARDAYRIGLDSCIYSYAENLFKPGNCYDANYKTKIKRFSNPGDPVNYRKVHHLSEIDVLEGDGKRYIYGIPAYSIKQKDVTFSLNSGQGNNQTQLTTYNAGQNSTANNSGRDALFQSEEIPAYAHSFLLTAILSPDFVDVKGDGITDDDIGTAIKFNYTRVNKQAGVNAWYSQKWRSPMMSNSAHFNPGLKTDNADDKGLYTYGEKELWYTHSIETKNMVATFTLSGRHDGKQVIDENGGLSLSNGQRKLDRMDLYTKADYAKYGGNAKPIKTVHFAYSYSLCGNTPSNDMIPEIINGVNINQNKGKLTLDSLWFSYNGNYKQTKNKYRFKYAEGRNGVSGNPNYNAAQSDRWGIYKDNNANPSGIANDNFPYTLQKYTDTLKNNVYASSWNLEKIMLPSGAIINIGYEADDYAYVQNKRASQMTKIAGFGNSATATPQNKLYSYTNLPLYTTNPGMMDHRFVFFDVEESVTSKADIYNKYLDNMKQLLLKIWVEMPSNSYGTGYEPVTVYSTIKDYYLVAGNNKRFCIELNTNSKGGSPIMETVIQFLKDYLPSKAYKGYDVGDQSGIRQVVSAVQGMSQGLLQAIEGFENNLKANRKCNLVDLNYSFARLCNPTYKKIGGGHRVKSIVITDNWKKMSDPGNTNPSPLDSYYGQIYDYTTTESIKGVQQVISSGVATYEPGIGNEENPFREILQYRDKQPLGPTNVSNVELPVTETFFPSPSVGYSKVTVRSIHNKSNKNIKSGVGKQVTEFYTSKDFPVFTDFTDFDSRSRSHFKPSAIMRIFFQQKKDFLTLSQGFRVILNDMNGKMKSQASYAENDLQNPINSTTYYYRLANKTGNTYRLDNNIKVINGAKGIVNTKLVGKEVEVMNDFREHYSSTQSAQIPLNVESFTIAAFPIIIPSIFRAMFKEESIYRSATTLKIVNEYGILDSIVNVDKGSQVSTKNIVYDGETGEVLVTRTNNEYNKSTYSLNFPAHWVNSGMSMAYKNIDLTYKNVKFVNGKIEGSPQVNMANFESGDEIYVIDYANQGPLNTPGCILTGGPSYLPMSNEYKIWALDIAKDDKNLMPSFIFIDRYGNPYNAASATIRVIRSGKRNMGGTSIGSIVSLNNPLVTTAGVEKIDVSMTSNVLNAGAIEFKEKWRVQDGFYSVDTTVYTKRYVPVRNAFLTPTNQYEYGEYHRHNRSYTEYYGTPNSDFVLARAQSFGIANKWTKRRDRGFMLFNINEISSDATIISANLQLTPDMDKTSYTHYFFKEGSHNNWNPHAYAYNHSNAFRVNRILSSWPANGSSAWHDMYFATGGTGYLNEAFHPTPLQPQQSANINIKGLFTGMVRDKNDPTKNYAPGLKISLITDNFERRDEARVCFGAANIQVKYFKCSEAYPIGYIPPTWEEVDSCIIANTGSYCFSVFTRKQMNPYVYGVLGNWRPYRSYVYYGDRKEKDPVVQTNISKDGVIDNFENYWIPGTNYLQRTGSSKWVWNSEITQYNRKGVEIENHDPLDRYNAGVYGYQETLPIAVANNARVREIAFDGFEDHSYKDELCEPLCKPSKRHFNVGNIASFLTTSQHHTGKYSLSIPSNSSYTINSVILANDTASTPTVRIKMDSTAFTDTIFTLNGTGLKGTYFNNQFDYGQITAVRNPDMVNLFFKSKNNSNACIDHGNLPPSVPRCGNISVIWEGKIQVLNSGNYYFNLGGNPVVDDDGDVYINNTLVCKGDWNNPSNNWANPVLLKKGEAYTIKVMYRQYRGIGNIQLRWRLGTTGQFVPVPAANLYPLGQTVAPPVYGTSWCVKPDTIQSVKHNLIDSFSLIASKRYILSAWVKEGTLADTYVNNAIELTFNGNYFMNDAKPSGNVIEGWQRYDFDFTVPSNAVTMQVKLKSLSGIPVYFDDLRIHPFNSNLKSFVYNPENLRLAAELDENNYASFYEYDDEGTLVRVKKETKDGIKTITETRSALQKSLPNF